MKTAQNNSSLESGALSVELHNCDIYVKLKETRSFVVNVADKRGNVYVVSIEVPAHEFECNDSVQVSVHRQTKNQNNLENPTLKYCGLQQLHPSLSVWFHFSNKQKEGINGE